MPLDYLHSDNIAVQRLKSAHDSKVSHIRGDFFAAEFAFLKKHIRNKKVLVAGSGLGHDTFELARNNHEVTGLELHPELIRLAQEMKDRLHLSHVSFIQGDFNHTTFPNDSFDVAIVNMGTIGTVEHPIAVLKELLRVANVVYVDFYPPWKNGIKKRIRMYTEEGWQNVRFNDETKEVVSDDGMSSKSLSYTELKNWASRCDAQVSFHKFCDFAVMAEFQCTRR